MHHQTIFHTLLQSSVHTANSLINKTKSQLEVCQEPETTNIKVTPKRQQQKFHLSFLSGMATVESESLKWCPRGASTVKTEEEEEEG